MDQGIIAAIAMAVVLCISLVVAIAKYKTTKSSTSELSVEGFISMYGDSILTVAEEAVKFISEADYQNNSELIDAITDKTIDILYNECDTYEIDLKYIKLIGKENLKTIVSSVVVNCYDAIMETLKKEVETNEKELEESVDDSTTTSPVTVYTDGTGPMTNNAYNGSGSTANNAANGAGTNMVDISNLM